MPENERSHDDQITSAIGKVAASWARFEFRLTEIIWHLANLDIEIGACITAQIQSPSSRLRCLAALVGVRGGDQTLIDSINKFSVHADSLARQRNRFVHDPWIVNPAKKEDPVRIEVTADRKLRFEGVKTSLNDMERLWLEIYQAITTLDALYLRLKSELPPWNDTLHAQSRDKHPVLAYTDRNSSN